MRLADLDPRWLGLDGTKLAAKPERGYFSILCPKCFSINGGAMGTHRLNLPFSEQDNHWHAIGSSEEDLTFVPPGKVSVKVVGGCEAHFLIRKGSICFA